MNALRIFRLTTGSVFAALLFLLSPRVSVSATFNVNCPGQTIQAALNAAGVDDTINVTGTCNENLLVDNNKMKVYLDGGGTATIHGVDASRPVLDIRGKAILVQGLTITGGRDGIEVHRGSNAVINSNVIQNMIAGIVVYEVAFAVITNNTIQNNSQVGIIVHGNAAANIGVNSPTDPVASPNIIQNNGVDGILLSGVTQANIIGNIISGNPGRGGIELARGAQANIAKNTINANLNGIFATEGAGLNLGGASESTLGGILPLFAFSNSTTVKNGQFGIVLGIGAYAAGNLGTLNGNSGPEGVIGTSYDDSQLFP